MLGVEALEQVVARRDRQLEALPDVAQVELAQELDRVARDALARELGGRGRARAPAKRASSSAASSVVERGA